MFNQDRELTKEELKMMEDVDRLLEEMNNHPEITSEPFPEELHERIWNDIRAYEAEHTVPEESAKMFEVVETPRLSKEEEELIRLGKIYRRKKKNRKFYILVAAVIGAMAVSVTSMGGPEKVFERFRFEFGDRDQEHINSSNGVELNTKAAEEEIYQQIEDEYGFVPVRMTHMPEGIEFKQAALYDNISTAEIIFGDSEVNYVTYQLNIGYRDSSISGDFEDRIVDQYYLENDQKVILIKEYYLKEYKETRWLAEFEHAGNQYFIKGIDLAKEDFEEILKNLYFF